ncbi:MAG TPA: glycosyl hydrolase 115 family protein [Candidatus Acidoferrum sp.]|nr:glycosyl hydrolase 115 family protein [Candidatus Acidoferrum sp.]
MKLASLVGLGLLAFVRHGFALGQAQYVELVAGPGAFAIVQNHAAATLLVDSNDFAGVVRAAGDLRQDIARVTSVTPELVYDPDRADIRFIIIGTIGQNELIDRLIREGKIDVAPITNKWESFLIQVVPNPWPGVAGVLVIAGSDKRGTIYGIYDLSEQIGVSPWYWWADVTPEHRDALFAKPGKSVQGPPAVKYRGIFLNDEAPDLSNWITNKFGTIPVSTNPPIPPGVANYGRGFYTNLFELILRLKGNYLWPAMWNNAFNEDDPENPRLADEYGVVMGTSHQEPMLRAQKEWDRGLGHQYGNWNYNNTNQQPVLQQFWRDGIHRNRDYENIITLGLRAENDSGLPIGKELTEQIVNVQRQILTDEFTNLAGVPQLWCLYKEVQGFYSDGLRVPDDVTLLWAEDNWGNVRRLPTADERQRPGGAGVYYHFDYHGGPRSYQWLNTSPIPKVWEQLSLAKQYGADRIWIVNVGHFKGYEFPIEYFMHLGWNTDRWGNTNFDEFTRLWAAREFGPAHADDIADIVAKYTKYNGRRKPELLAPDTYSLVNYQEAENVVNDFRTIAARAEEIYRQLPAHKRDAFYELVLFPTKVCALLNELYLAAGKNALYARQGRASANDWADETRALFQADTNLMNYFNQTFAGGKWNHFMDQPVIGYTSWRDPAHNNLDAIKLTQLDVPPAAAMGVAVEGSEAAWPGATNLAVLPTFDVFNRQIRFIDVFNKGKTPFDFKAKANKSWIALGETKGTVEKDKRLWVGINWDKVPKGKASGTVTITGAGTNVTVIVNTFNPKTPTRATLDGFVEGEGCVSIEPEHYTAKVDVGARRWMKIDDYGRTLSGMRAEAPVDLPSVTPGSDSPTLEYRLYLFSTNPPAVTAITAPTLNFVAGRGLRYAVSFDDEPPQTVTLVPENYTAQNGNADWEQSVKDNARFGHSTHPPLKPGDHTLKLWMVDPGVVLQKIVVDLGGVRPSYLGPPESYRAGP